MKLEIKGTFQTSKGTPKHQQQWTTRKLSNHQNDKILEAFKLLKAINPNLNLR